MDFYEEYVRDVFSGMGGFSKDGKLLDNMELTENQIKNIKENFASSKDTQNLLNELDCICIDCILEELGKSGISY